jgi:pheromone shutdown protein TraB
MMVDSNRNWRLCRSWLFVVACILCFVVPTTIEASSTTGTGLSSTNPPPPPPTAFIRPTTANDAVVVDTNTTSKDEYDDDDDDEDVSSSSSPPVPVSTNDTINATNININIPEWKRRLPAPLNNKTKTLQRIIVPGPQNRKVEVYLLGTAHVSKDSSRDVRLLLETIEPNVIFLELCDGRVGMLIAPPPSATTTPTTDETNNTGTTTPTKKGFFRRLFRRGPKQPPSSEASSKPQPKSMYTAAATLLTNMQQDYASSLGVELGGEFRVAYDYWEHHRKNRRLHMILGDRPLYLTLTRAWESLRLWGKIKLLIGLLLSTFQKPNPDELKAWMESILSDDSGDLLTESIAELAQHFPTLEEVIIRERDAYMACKLYQTCRELLTAAAASRNTNNNDNNHHNYKMVAIVGAGHVEGMCQWLTNPPATGGTPEEVLSRLIQIKKGIPEEDQRYLAHDVLEVNHEQLQEMAEQQELAEQR